MRLLAASWRLPALPKTVLPSTRQPRLPETPAAVYAPWAVALKTSQNTLWNGGVGQIDQMSEALGRLPIPRNGSETGAPVYAPCEVGPKPRLPSPRKRDSVLPSTRRGGVWKKHSMSCVLGLVLEAPGALRAALKMPEHEPLKVLWEVPVRQVIPWDSNPPCLCAKLAL